MENKLSRTEIMKALDRLDVLLREKGIVGELCIFGGAAMVLAFDARESTRDVDGIFVPKNEVIKCARQVSMEMNIDLDWLNDGVKGFVSPTGEVTTEGMPVYDNLRIMRPSTEYLLAMKCLASRIGIDGQTGDRGDVITLLNILKIYDAICDLVARYYKESLLPPKIRFFIEEIIDEIKP